jgi:hypothetical protein
LVRLFSCLIYCTFNYFSKKQRVRSLLDGLLSLQAVDTSGVEKAANVSIHFDPSYQTLTLHAINLIRAGQLQKKLGSTSIKVLQQKKELEALIYDGQKSVNALLNDVRVGDIVEYSYSVDGMNPVFQNMVSGGSDMLWRVAVERVFLRLMVPSARHIAVKARNTSLQAQVLERDGYRDVRWNVLQQPELLIDPEAPDWFNPYAMLEWSEFPDWAAVAQWALPLYRTSAQLGEPLQREVDAIAAADRDPARRIAAVLRLVQRDIRYLGIEVGLGSHAPAAPATIFQRRFGDCKDKALLMIAMLRVLGLETNAALVHTSARQETAKALPSPGAFNHVLVQVRLAGKAL